MSIRDRQFPRRARFVRLVRTVFVALAVAGCTSAPPTSAPAGSAASPATDAAASAPVAEPTSDATSALAGQPPPVDPCSLLQPDEILLVLGQTPEPTSEETLLGAAQTCSWRGGERLLIRATVFKGPQTPATFIRRRAQLPGDRVTVVDDIGDGAYLLQLGPNAAVYVLQDSVEFFIDVTAEGKEGLDLRNQTLALGERAASRVP